MILTSFELHTSSHLKPWTAHRSEIKGNTINMTSPQPPLMSTTPVPGTVTAAGQVIAAPPPVRKPPLKIGDIVFCCRWCTGVFPEDPEKPSLYSLLAEGIVDDKVEGINSDDWLPQPNLCLRRCCVIF